MKTFNGMIVLAVVIGLLAVAAPAQVPEMINYQGRVALNGTNFNGTGQFKFVLGNAGLTTTYWSNDGSSTGGGEPTAAVGIEVVKGLFSVQLGDTTLAHMTALPASVFMNPDVRLRIWFNDGGGSQQLSPDQRITSVGYAMRAGSVVGGTGGGTNLLSYRESGTFTPAPSASGVNSIAQGAGASAQGQGGVVAGGVGNTNKSNYAFLGGGYYNTIDTDSGYAVIGGGMLNQNSASHGAIGGGWQNLLGTNAQFSYIGGGWMNEVGQSAQYSFIGGGFQNKIELNSAYSGYSVVGGGSGNTVQREIEYATIAGGAGNRIEREGDASAIGGGSGNTVASNAMYATIPGGYQNVAGGSSSLAAGRRAKANHLGAFVWADSTDADFTSTANNQFLVRAAGGVGIGTNVTPRMLTVAGDVQANSYYGDGSHLTGIGSGGLTAGSVSNVHLAANAVTSDKILNGTILFADIASNSAAAGQVMKWNGSAWAAANDDSGGSALKSYKENGTFAQGPLASGIDAIAQGAGASAVGDYSIVGGGFSNVVGISANYATIGGGNDNEIQLGAIAATIGGGQFNSVESVGISSTIGGGHMNLIGALAGNATVAGGDLNKVYSSWGAVGGGFNNVIQASADYAMIGGGRQNTIRTNAQYAAIGGGGPHIVGMYAQYATIGGGGDQIIGENADYATISGGRQNTINLNAQHSTIGGGRQNRIDTEAEYATIGGGYTNTIATNADYSTIGGGGDNTIHTNAQFAAIGGGALNAIFTNANYATIGGGNENTIEAAADRATIGGGWGNRIGSQAYNATIPGGRENAASGYTAFAAGRRAKANHDGAFVWADHADADFASSGNDQFLIRAAGGVGIGTNSPQSALDVNGTTRTKVLVITGGADLSEHFDIRSALPRAKPQPGMVVSIDPDHPGSLVVCAGAYDRRVAGIISGAGDIGTGLVMGQEGSCAAGNTAVALTGRVYCWADASHGPIVPGDLLTTSDTPGHAMKVGDHGKAQGAIIGKAMSSLESGQGLVLVLVSLQ